MSDAKVNSGSNGKEHQQQGVSQDTPGLTELLKAQIRLIAAQRNMNDLALQINTLTVRHHMTQQEAAKAEADFHAVRERVQRETSLVYNDEKLRLENKTEPNTL